MNREVEERIVAMYFDNNDFEKNAKQTIETLGQLKNGLNLEDSAKGFNVFEKIGKTLNFDKANQGLTKMRTTLGSVGERFKKAFKIGSEPLREAEGFLSQLRGYITKYVGFDIAGKIVNSLESSIRALTVQPISAGWNQYQSKMDSVKTIMSSTGESISDVNRELESMTEYAKKTIYSLTDMTSNLGKFTNNGVDLQRSVKAMEGIANAAADAGQGAQQASMAMYNISQAIGVGKMTTIDWKSIENANMATQKLKNTFLEMAALQGRIEKQTEKDGSISYMLTKDDEGNKLKTSIKLTAANFREYLSKGWLDKETMLRAFEVYSGTVDDNTLESWGIHDVETKKRLMELGQQALESATQVRTFSKMMDALAESAQSGWAQSFELIFGNMEQGTTLWTTINNVLDEVLTKSAEARNSILKIWAGEDQNVESENKTLEEKNAQMEQLTTYLHELETSGDPTGAVNRQVNYIKQQVSQYQSEIDKIKKSDKPQKEKDTLIKKKQAQISELQKTQKKLEAKQKDLAKQEKARNKDEAEAAGYQAQIDAYKKEIEELNKTNIRDSEGDIDAQKQKQRDRQIAEKQKKVDELQKKIDKINSKYGGDEIAKTKKEIEELQKEIDDLNGVIEEKTGHAKSEFVDEQGRSGRDIALASLYELIDLAKELGSAISEAFGNVFGKLDAQGLFNFTQKISNGIHSIVEWFGKLEDSDSRLSKLQKGLQGFLSIIKAIGKIVKIVANLAGRLLRPVINWLVDIFGKFGKTFDGLGELDPAGILIAIGDKLKDAWESIKKFFTPTALYDDKGNYTSTDIPVISWLKKLWGKVKDIVRDWANENGFGQIYDTVTEWWEKIRSSLGQARETLIDKWMEVKQWFIDSGISQFFSDVWGWITSLFTPTSHLADENGHELKNQKAPIVTWLSDIWEGIQSIWGQIIAWPVWNSIAAFAGNTWAWIVGQFKPTSHLADENGHELKDQRAPVLKWLSGIWDGIKVVWNQIVAWPVWNSIATFASNTWTWIVSQFKPTSHLADANGHELKDQRAPVIKWLGGIWDGIKDVWNQIISWPVWNNIATFASNTWTWIVSRFKPTSHLADANGHELKDQRAPVVKWLGGIWDGIKETWAKLSGWEGWAEISEFFQNTWGWIVGLFRGNNEGATAAAGEAKASEPTSQNAEEELGLFERIINAIADFVTRVIEAVKGVVIPPAISTFLDNMFKFMEGLFKVIGDVMGSFGKWMKGEKVEGADFWNIFLTIIGGLSLVVTSMINNKFLSGISVANNIGTQILEICGGLLLIAAAVALLTTVDQNKLGAAAGIMVTFGIIIGVITGIIAKMSQNHADAAVTSGERIINNLINTIGKVGMLAVVLGLLPGIIETIGKVKKDLGGAEIGQDVLNVFLGVTALISGMSLVMAIVQKMTGGTGLHIGATVSTIVSLMAGLGVVLGLFAASGGILELVDGVVDKIAGNDVDTIGAITSGMKKVGALIEGVGKALGSFFKGIASAFGFKTSDEQINDSQDTIMTLAEFSEVLDTEKIAGISRIMSLMTQLSQNANVVDSDKIGRFQEGMESLARGILSMNWIIDGIDDLKGLGNVDSASYKKAEAAINIVNKLTTALSPIAGVERANLSAMRDFVINLGSDSDLLTSFVENLKNIISKLGEVDTEGIQFDGVSIVGKLYKAIDQGLKDPALPSFDATSIVDAIIKAIGLGDTAIAAFVHEMVQRGIDLSGSKNGAGEFELDDSTTNLLTKLLGGEGGTDTGFMFDTSALEKQLYGEDGKGGLLGEFSSFEDKIPSLSSMFDNKGWINFTDENGNEIDILGTLQGKMTELGTTLDTMEPLQLKITPVFDMTNMTPDKLQEALMANPVTLPININNGKMALSFEGLGQELQIAAVIEALNRINNQVSDQGRNTYNAIGNLSTHMDSIASEVSNLKLVLDTGVLVGQISGRVDSSLGLRAFIAERTGTVSKYP